MNVGRVCLLAVAGLVLAGCRFLQQSTGEVGPDCSAWDMPPGRCRALAAVAREGLPEPGGPALRIRLLPPEADDATRRVAVFRVRFDFLDGTFAVGEVFCGLSNRGRRECADDPEIDIRPIMDRDIPCNGEAGAPGTVCATSQPTPDPAAAAKGRPLQVAALDVPVPAAGHHEIEVGRAALPNGYLSDLSIRLADPAPDAVYVPEGIRLEVRPVDPQRPPFTGPLVSRPLSVGPEDVVVFVVFDAVDVGPGAILEVRDLMCR